ncbi:MAG: serine hydrolase [Chloroflexi bacterium OHK40]
MHRPRLAVLGLLCLALATGCARVAPQPGAARAEPTAAPPTVSPAPPTVAPTATPPPVFAAGSTVGGVDVGGLTIEAAAARLRAELPSPDPVELRAGDARLTLDPSTIGLAPSADDLLALAEEAVGSTAPAQVPLRLHVDRAALRASLRELAATAATPPTVEVITGTDTLSRSFALLPGRTLDIDAATRQVAERLARGDDGPIELALAPDTAAPRVPLARVREELATLAETVPGVVGVHLIDLESGEQIGLNDHTVFAGASTIKTAIMLYLYANVEELTERQEFWLGEMIRYSDNLSANDLLAAGAGGSGTDWAFVGAEQMSTMLQEELGLRHTYLYVPYETTDYIKLYKPSFRCGPAGPVGERPYTEMGPCLRAEPASMARLYQLIDECAGGTGTLLDRFELLSPERCQEMLDWLARNADKTRMVAGIPAGVRVEHKSGWIEDMQADCGVVRSEGGDYVACIYYYRPLDGKRDFWTDEQMAPVVAAFSHLIYTAFNPVVLSEEEHAAGVGNAP